MGENRTGGGAAVYPCSSPSSVQKSIVRQLAEQASTIVRQPPIVCFLPSLA